MTRQSTVYLYAAILFYGSCIFAPYPLLTYYCYQLIRHRYWNAWTIVVACYMIWIWLIDATSCENGSKRYRSSWVRSLSLAKINAKYFPMSLQKTSRFTLDGKKNHLFCVVPHGVMALGAFFSFGTDALNCEELFPEVRRFTLFAMGPLFKIPFIREILMFHGLASCSSKSIEYVLDNPKGGNAGVLVVGGLRELLITTPSRYRLYIKNRKGFVRMALERGVPLVPVLNFGENDVFHVYPKKLDTVLRKVQFWLLDRTGIPFLFAFAYGCFPYAKPISVVVGPPLELPKIAKPTQREVDYYHKIFVRKIVRLFERNKRKYVPDRQVKVELC